MVCSSGTCGIYGCGFSTYGWIIQIIIFLLIFLIFWWMIRGSNKYGYKTNSKDSAQEILKKRYASGEIKKEEYEKMKKEFGD